MDTPALRKSYNTDLSDEQWKIIAPKIVLPTGGRPKTTNLREIVNAKGLPRLEKVLADDGYSGQPMVDYVHQKYSWEFESVKRTELHTFKVMLRRWAVERTICQKFF